MQKAVEVCEVRKGGRQWVNAKLTSLPTIKAEMKMICHHVRTQLRDVRAGGNIENLIWEIGTITKARYSKLSRK